MKGGNRGCQTSRVRDPVLPGERVIVEDCPDGTRGHFTPLIEKGPTSYGAHVLELPGCVAAAETREEVSTLIREAIRVYIEELEKEGLPIPEPRSSEMIGG